MSESKPRKTESSRKPGEPLDVLLGQWREANALSAAEVRGIRNRVLGLAPSPQPGLTLEWWRECLGAGIKPLTFALGLARVRYQGPTIPA